MRFSLSWHNFDDLDIHVQEPDGTHIYFSNMRPRVNGGWLDVDMNAGGPTSREAVENITWEEDHHIREGRYKVWINQYTKNETSDFGFQVEMEINGEISLFSYDKPMRTKENVDVIEFNYSRTNGITKGKSLPSSTLTKEVWGIETQKWTKVNMILNSPNFWNGEKVGNKHVFFILDKCLNYDKARGFYNEVLMNELHDHRKALELLSSKMKTEQTNKQLSGVGFSSTQENYLLAKVSLSSKVERVVKIVFAQNMSTRFDKPKVDPVEIGRCEVCKGVITSFDDIFLCPHNGNSFHTSHFLEWVRIKGECPVCREPVTHAQINEVLLIIGA